MTTPMSAERFADRFRFYSGQPQQQRGVLELHAAISSSDQGSAILDEQAPWALTYSEQPPEPPLSAGGLDPRGSEEAGMAGPQLAAPVQPGDTYLPSKKLAIPVTVTVDEAAFDKTGGNSSAADTIFREIVALLAPDEPPPVRRP